MADQARWIIADKEGKAWRMEKGAATVFVVPVKDEIPLRRLFLCDVTEGEAIPNIKAKPSEYILADYMTLLILPDSDAKIAEIINSKEIDDAFSAKIGHTDTDGMTMGEFVDEKWELQDVLELRAIYQSAEANQNALHGNLKNIASIFDKRGYERLQQDYAGKPLYDAVAKMCAYQKINLKTWDEIKNAGIKKLNIHDISRISNFACREIVLPEDWYRQDMGALLVYVGAHKVPMACIPRDSAHYDVYDPQTDTLKKLTKELVNEIRPKAVYLYRPFPETSLKLKDVIKYSAEAMRVSDLVSVIVFTLIGVVIGQFLPILNQQIFDKYIPMGDFSGLYGISMVVLAFSVGNVFFQLISNMSSFRFLNRIKYQLEAAIVDRLFSLPESFYRDYESADLAERAMTIANLFTKLMEILLKNTLTAIFSFLYLFRMFHYSKRLTWIALIMCLLSTAICLGLDWLQIKYEREMMSTNGRISSLLYQLISGVGKLRISGAEERGIREYTKLYTRSTELGIRNSKIDRIEKAVSSAFSTVIMVVLYYTMIHKNMGLSIGAFMAFNSAYGSFSSALNTLVSSFLEVNDMIPAYGRIKPILLAQPEYSSALAMPGELEGEIELTKVRFSYRADLPEILHGIDLKIKPGEYIGVVGETGGGKSTLLKLLLGFEEPTEGQIFYDGMDIAMLDKRELRKRFGVVLQDGGLITGSIRENITITNPAATEEEIKEAIANAGLTEDLKKMPMGLNTVLSEGDGSISGGQKQRILIARAIVGKPKILFFDEATSALDNNTQRIVREGLDSLHSTRIVIAHRLSTIINCDRILVLHNGVIEECGNFEELMAQKGYFYQLASRQMA